MSVLRRLPLRVRLVAGFTTAMLVLLSLAGVFVYWRVDYALDRRLDIDLRAEAAAVRPLIADDGSLRVDPTTSTVAAEEPALSDFQVLDPAGRVLSSGNALGGTALLDDGTTARARRGALTVDVGSLLPVSPRPLRVLAQPLGPAAAPTSGSSASGPLVLVVAVRRDERDEALRELIAQLAIAGSAALLISTLVGERLARAALTPVERYRARAGRIAAGDSGVRLDVPLHRDDEVTRLGRTLNEMLDALDEAARRERRFVDDASHELRTPLTLLLTRVQFALRRRRTVEEHEEVLRELQDDIAGLVTLTQDLLTLGTLDHDDRRRTDDGSGPRGGGAVGPAADPVAPSADVVAVARHLHALSRTGGDDPAGGAGDVELPPAWSLTAPADAGTRVAVAEPHLRRVLLNLLTNAQRHGAPPITLTLDRVGVPAGEVVTVTVTDAGPGIPPDFLPRAVERFSRTARARPGPGSGLGLALVHAVVEGGGGELRLCSHGVHHRFEQRWDVPCVHPGDGTTAVVVLPVRTA